MTTPFHFEVVDADDCTVGSARFTDVGEAQQLMAIVADLRGVGPLAVAKVVERIVVKRQVTRLEPAAA